VSGQKQTQKFIAKLSAPGNSAVLGYSLESLYGKFGSIYKTTKVLLKHFC